MAAPALTFLSGPQAQLDDLLSRICHELQLDEQRYSLAEQHYKAVGDWLQAEGSEVARFKPLIYPQGSMRLETTNQPLRGEEYDLDFVCELAVLPRFFENPIQALRLIEGRLRQHGTYTSMVEVKNRCIRLNYEHFFHMDILPACHDQSMGGTCIVVPDRVARTWKESNPKGYAEWFEKRGALLMMAKDRAMVKAEPIPDQKAATEKTVLALLVQLWKRCRDLWFDATPDVAPVSIVLTTLAGHAYRGEQSISEAFSSVIATVHRAVREARPRLVVLNPTNQREDLSERWDKGDGSYFAFVRWIAELEKQWADLRTRTTIPDFNERLKKLFGESVSRTVVEKQARDVEKARQSGRLSVRRNTGAIIESSAAAGITIPRNTFYGTSDE